MKFESLCELLSLRTILFIKNLFQLLQMFFNTYTRNHHYVEIISLCASFVLFHFLYQEFEELV
jgi:hypothetical protein